jgi:hypothetical protein
MMTKREHFLPELLQFLLHEAVQAVAWSIPADAVPDQLKTDEGTAPARRRRPWSTAFAGGYFFCWPGCWALGFSTSMLRRIIFPA